METVANENPRDSTSRAEEHFTTPLLELELT